MNPAVIRQGASHLLAYPDERFWARLPLLRPALLPHFSRFIARIEALAPGELAAHYVDTFDLKRRCCLYLTYYTDGDTRRRGQSLAVLKAHYRAAGWELLEDELPDFLPVMLEFAALTPSGGDVLCSYRAQLETLLAALRQEGSPYSLVVEVVCATLPPLTAAERELSVRLARSGPPAESVGTYR